MPQNCLVHLLFFKWYFRHHNENWLLYDLPQLTLPMTKMFTSLVAKLLPVLSLTCTTSKEPGCLSLLMIVPIRPKLAPPVTMHMAPIYTEERDYLGWVIKKRSDNRSTRIKALLTNQIQTWWTLKFCLCPVQHGQSHWPWSEDQGNEWCGHHG